MIRNLILSTSLLALSAAASAQCTLTVAGTGAAGTALTFTVDGSNLTGFAFLAIGDTTGTTQIDFGPLGVLSLGLEFPFQAVPIGPTDLQGDASLQIAVPATLPASVSLYAQGIPLGIDFTPGGGLPGLDFCSTNVEAFTIG